MSANLRRIRAIQAIVAGSVLKSSKCLSVIQDEFGETYRVRRVRRDSRRHLLQVLHSTRALDTSLREFILYHSLGSANTLGGYLNRLTFHTKSSISRLTNLEKKYYQSKIVDVRNRYMHEAGSFPAQESEVQALLSEMQSCLHRVTNL